MVAPETIQEMVQRITEKFDPIRVILFGSQARGDARPGSDVDFLVVMPDGTQVKSTTIAILRELGDADAAKDIVVTTPAALERYGKSPGLVYRYALREGKVLYERS